MLLRVILDGTCRRLAPIEQGGVQGGPRAFDSGLQARLNSKRLCLIPLGGLHRGHYWKCGRTS